MFNIGPVAFAEPWLLLSLMGVPLVWFMLRTMPPVPNTYKFSALWLITQSQSSRQFTDRAPLWIVIIRLTYISLLIIALANPKMHSFQHLNGSHPLLIVIDNGWASGSGWQQRSQTANKLISAAELKKKDIFVATTAREPDRKSRLAGPLTVSEALLLVDQIIPKPWSIDPLFLTQDKVKKQLPRYFETHWISDGIFNSKKFHVIEHLKKYGPVLLLQNKSLGPTIISYIKHKGLTLQATVMRSTAELEGKTKLSAVNKDNRVITTSNITFKKGELTKTVEVRLPEKKKNEINRFVLQNEANAAAVYLVDESLKKVSVGIATRINSQSPHPLLNEVFYLKTALSDSSYTKKGTLDKLSKKNIPIILVPDAYQISIEEKANIRKWVEAGGTLIRFSGPNLAANLEGESEEANDSLIPVKLRGRERAFGGSLSWQQPLNITTFNRNSPLSNLPRYKDVLVRRQLLATPAPTLKQQTWASLSDGTPIITAKNKGDGRIILFHTTATPEWSDLVISGQFVEMLQRLIKSKRTRANSAYLSNLSALKLLDGFGQLRVPPTSDIIIPNIGLAKKLKPGPIHPPGFYGSSSAPAAFNLSLTAKDIKSETVIPRGIETSNFDLVNVVNLSAHLFYLALGLLLIDTLIILFLNNDRINFFTKTLPKVSLLFLIILLGIFVDIISNSALADSKLSSADRFALTASSQTRLVFAKSGTHETDVLSLSALRTLTDALRERTAASLGDPLGVNIESDDLAFFNILFCPLSALKEPLSINVQNRLNNFMDNGGILFIDSQNAIESRRSVREITSLVPKLRAIGPHLNIFPLVPITRQHTLMRSFYILKSFPGRFSNEILWVRNRQFSKFGELTPIIAGTNDWIRAWAKNKQGDFVFSMSQKAHSQRELSIRFGINLVIYALTGNYKSDQLHTNNILKRIAK